MLMNKYTDNIKENVKMVLKQIDDALTKIGVLGHQERMLRIYKTFMATEKHSECYVSKFQDEETKFQDEETKEENQTFMTFNKGTPALILYTDNQTKKVEFELDEDDPKKKKFILSLDELVGFIETTLANSQDSSDDGKEADSSLIKTEEEKSKKRELNKKFFSIELKLRSFIRESDDILNKSNFNSFINDQRLQTPPDFQSIKSNHSKKSMGNEMKSPITHNFFKEKEYLEILEIQKKRKSQNHYVLKNDLAKFTQEVVVRKSSKAKSNENFKTSSKKGEEASKKIRIFNPEFEDEAGKEIVEEKFAEVEYPSEFKNDEKPRGSIFQDKSLQLNIMELAENETNPDEDFFSENSPISPTKTPCSKKNDEQIARKFD